VTLVGSGQQSHEDAADGDQATRSLDSMEGPAFGELLSQVPADVRDVSFATAVRGYDRREVDAYVERVNRVIAELEISRSPRAAVKPADPSTERLPRKGAASPARGDARQRSSRAT
jgi:DivIVA domain-containing protein